MPLLSKHRQGSAGEGCGYWILGRLWDLATNQDWAYSPVDGLIS